MNESSDAGISYCRLKANTTVFSTRATYISVSPRENNCAAEARSNAPEKDDNMLMSDGLLRVFWPYDLPRPSASGVIVGWRNSELDLFVLTVLEDVEVSGLPLEDIWTCTAAY